MKTNPFGRKTPASLNDSSALRPCDHPGCSGDGLYRAPKSRSQLNEYYWFCLEHVRAYNASWDFYAGMNPAEIEKHIRFDTIWQRKTWPLGHLGASHRLRIETSDPFSFLEGETKINSSNKVSPYQQDLQILGLSSDFSRAELKSTYITLVKKYHPDLNQGNKEAEEKLKKIIAAYKRLLQSLES